MKASYSSLLFAATLLVFQGRTVQAADAGSMMEACRARAAKALGVAADAIEVEYEGQRTDQTHAVNGSAFVRGQDQTFQCSFARNGRRIVNFVANAPQGGGAGSSAGTDDDKVAAASRRAGVGDFDARGRIPCAQAKGQPMGQCNFGVTRAGGGTATVVVSRPDGRMRAIFFDNGKAISADTSQADGYAEFHARKEGDLFHIRVGNERYEIPEAVIFGG